MGADSPYRRQTDRKMHKQVLTVTWGDSVHSKNTDGGPSPCQAMAPSHISEQNPHKSLPWRSPHLAGSLPVQALSSPATRSPDLAQAGSFPSGLGPNATFSRKPTWTTASQATLTPTPFYLLLSKHCLVCGLVCPISVPRQMGLGEGGLVGCAPPPGPVPGTGASDGTTRGRGGPHGALLTQPGP